MKWTLLDSPPASALDNMAIDLALLRRAAPTGRAVLRLYAWERATVSFGRHESVKGVWDVDALQAAGLQVVRRPTGGRALLHAPEQMTKPSGLGYDVTYSVTLPLHVNTPWRDMYHAVNVRLLAALHSLGADASLSARTSSLLPDGALCFTAPSEGEIMLGDQKIAGSAVWRANGGYLQHGSILLRNEQPSLERFRVTADSVQAPLLRSAGIASTGAERRASSPQFSPIAASSTAKASSWSDAESVAQAVRNMWREMSRDICTFEPSPEDIGARAIASAELSAPDWLWRR